MSAAVRRARAAANLAQLAAQDVAVGLLPPVVSVDLAGMFSDVERCESIGEPLLALAALRLARDASADVESALVLLVRAGGATWADVGWALGITRQAAQSRFGPSL